MADIPLDELPELGDEYEGINAFVVGGAVRDWVRGIEPHDVDLMVCGASADTLQSRGFRHIDSPNNETFGVFLDSDGREVAMAREEVSTGDGHRDFEVTTVPADVPPVEALMRDLKRRDFTVNAMAYSFDGELFDPHGGVADLNAGVIRAVDETAFVQDPLRVLRGARFAARLDFHIHHETLGAMAEAAPKLTELPGERIRMEMEKAFKQSEHPRVFFDMLAAADALRYAFPELAALEGVPAGPEEYHEERDALHHTMLVLSEMQELRPNDEIALLMAMAHDLGKAATDEDDWPHHYGHGEASIPFIEHMDARLSFSNEQVRAMKEAAEQHMRLKNGDEMRDATLFDLYQETHNDDRLLDLMVADARGRRPQGDFNVDALRAAFRRAATACKEVTGQTLIDRGRSPEEMGGEKFGKHLRDARIARMKQLSAE